MVQVSVILPVFNGKNTILETIKSVLSQTITDLELIIINDGSTDSTLHEIEQIDDPRIQVLSFENAGVATSRNRGISQAKGEFLTFIDADDLWVTDKLEKQVAAICSNPQSAVVYSWTRYIDPCGKFIQDGWCNTDSGDVYCKLATGCFIENGSNILLRKTACDLIGGFNPLLTPTEDWDFYLRLAEKFDFVCVPEPQILYRVSPNSLSSNLLRMERSGIQTLKQAFHRSPDRLRSVRDQSLYNYYYYLIYRALEQVKNQKTSWIALKILIRGILTSPKLLQVIPKSTILSLVNQSVFNSKSLGLKIQSTS